MSTIHKLVYAARFAAEKHSGQVRQNSKTEPYVNHALEVTSLIANVGKIADIEILIAGLLHDTLEDTNTTENELIKHFGAIVCGYVLEVTDHQSLPKDRQKELQIERSPYLSHGAKIVKLADKISNIRDVIESPAADWEMAHRREYVEWSVKVIAGLRGENEFLETHFDELVSTARSMLF